MRIVKETSCGVILYRNVSGTPFFLLLHYPSGHWDFPKGHVEERDKDEMDTAKRELEEETGISQVELNVNYRETMHYQFYRGGAEKVKKRVHYFLGQTSVEEVKISQEHQGHEWLPYEEAMRKLTFKNAKDLLEKAYKCLC